MIVIIVIIVIIVMVVIIVIIVIKVKITMVVNVIILIIVIIGIIVIMFAVYYDYSYYNIPSNRLAFGGWTYRTFSLKIQITRDSIWQISRLIFNKRFLMSYVIVVTR